MNSVFAVEPSPLGRVVVAGNTPPGSFLFYTTSDFEGRLDPSVAAALEAFVADRGGIRATLATCRQVHGDAAAIVATSLSKWNEFSDCDALWSGARDVALGIKVADCLPVSLIDPEASVIMNVHSGWRGAARGIVPKTIAEVEDATAFRARRASAWLGPSIRSCCFEVGPEVVDHFESAFEGIAHFVDSSRARPHVDVPGLTAELLRRAGVPSASIFDSEVCTRCPDSMFHSCRRDRGGSGRNLAVVAQ
ncbi:MAG: polyphenol oxidase family protein [Thermoanaerobaculia bacterium]